MQGKNNIYDQSHKFINNNFLLLNSDKINNCPLTRYNKTNYEKYVL